MYEITGSTPQFSQAIEHFDIAEVINNSPEFGFVRGDYELKLSVGSLPNQYVLKATNREALNESAYLIINLPTSGENNIFGADLCYHILKHLEAVSTRETDL